MEVSNVKVMRDALLMVKELFDRRIMFQPDIRKAHEAVNTALAEPLRNCDVGTAEEQSVRFTEFCEKNTNRGIVCYETCPCKNGDGWHSKCELYWAQMPYKSEVK